MENKNKRGFFGRLVVSVLTLLALVGLVATILSVVNPYIDPKRTVWTTLFGLAFWEIFIYDVVIFLLLLLLWSKRAWVAVLPLAVAVLGLNRSYSLGSKVVAPNSVRVMSFNVHMFVHVDGETNREQFASQVVGMVREQNPDLLCCQEFMAFKSGVTRPQCIEDFAESAGFQYIYYNRKNNYGGNVIFSKYPITKVTEESGIGKEKVYGVMVEVDAGEKGKFHLANVHLLSYMITDDELDVLTNTSERQRMDTVGKSVLHKLAHAFQRRSDELQEVLEGMPPMEGPVIICGDFNEPPLSYNYRQMQKAGYVDTFMEVGHGIKPTYAGKLPLLRIDYIWANDKVTPLCFKRHREKASDHYPIMLDFKIQ